MTANTNTFHIDSNNMTFTLDLLGQGDVLLQIPYVLAKNIHKVESTRTGGQFEFEVINSNNSETTTVLLKSISYNPRKLSLSYDDKDVSVTPPRIVACSDSITLSPCKDDDFKASDTVIVYATVFNTHFRDMVPCNVITEIRDPNDVTVALKWEACTSERTGAIGPRTSAVVSTGWKPEEAGNYTLKFYVLDDIDRFTSMYALETKPVVISP
jgi:hypothetical protein